MRSIARTSTLLSILSSSIFPQVNVLTANYGNGRTSANIQETVLNTTNVNSGSFGKLRTFPVDGQIYAQPLYVGGIPIKGQGTHNIVYVATMHNSVYAIDADDNTKTLPLWQVNLGPSVLGGFLQFDDIDPEVGILGTPVIDLTRNVMYLVSDTFEQGAPVYRLHALDLSDGSEQLGGPVLIQATVNGTGDASQNGKISLDASEHLQRPGLLLLNGQLYVAFGSHGDITPAHGWLMAYDASNLQQLAVFNATPNGSLGSIWHSGRGIAADADGNILLATANGDYDGVTNFGQTFLKLNSKLSVLDWFTPVDWSVLSNDDEDIGAEGPLLVPGTNFLIGGGKAGTFYLVDRTQMGRLGGAPTQVFPTVNIAGIFNMALWSVDAATTNIYIQEQGSPVKAYRLVNEQFDTTPTSKSTFPTGGIVYQGLTVSSNGSAGGTGILWENIGDQEQPGVPGTLYAFDASDLTHLLWSSEMDPARDRLGGFAKFATPTVVNGKVYVPTFSHELVVYGPLSGTTSSTAPRIAAVLNGASFLGGPVSPGEVVAIFGSGLGPANLVGTQLDSAGRVSTQLGGTQVSFNGTPAPLLYTSAFQVGAVVPFAISSGSGKVQVAVTYGGQTAVFSTAPAGSTPAIFTSDSSGGGQGAVLNQNGSINSPQNPAKIGSTIVLYATGLGQTDPPEQDGDVESSSPNTSLPAAQSVSVQIGGVDAKVAYAGAAPGIVAGVFQINAVIPANISTGDGVPVIVQASGQISQGTLSVAVTK